jgi:hypothetical protein
MSRTLLAAKGFRLVCLYAVAKWVGERLRVTGRGFLFGEAIEGGVYRGVDRKLRLVN